MSINNNDIYWNLYSTIIISFIIFVSFTIVQSLIVLFLQKTAINDVSDVKLLAYSNLGLISFISSIAGALMILFFIKLKTENINDYLSLNSLNFKSSYYFFLATFALLIVMEFISKKYPDIFATEFVLESYKSANSLPLLYFGVVIFGPIFEEMLFRGFLFKGLEKTPYIIIEYILETLISFVLSLLIIILIDLSIFRFIFEFENSWYERGAIAIFLWGGVFLGLYIIIRKKINLPRIFNPIPFGGHGAVFISAILFSIIHIQYGIAVIVFLLFPMSILLGYARLKSNSLILPILLHSLNNLLTCIVTHFEVY